MTYTFEKVENPLGTFGGTLFHRDNMSKRHEFSLADSHTRSAYASGTDEAKSMLHLAPTSRKIIKAVINIGAGASYNDEKNLEAVGK